VPLAEALEAAGCGNRDVAENVEIAERGVAALNETYRTGDMRPWRRHVEETFDPDVLLEAEEAFTEGEWRGHEGAVGFVANQMEVLADMWLRVDDYVHVDDDCLVAAITFGGRARHTGLEVELHPLHVFTLRDGKAVRWQVFLEREQALEEVGLRE
jgi:ketosteroid isomerase-like protein